MDTVVSSPVEPEPELNLLTTWGEPDDAPRRRKAAVATALVHVLGITMVFLLPDSFFINKRLPEPQTHVTPIYELTRLTQRAPNSIQLPKEFSEQRGMGGRTPPAPAAPAPAPKRERAAAPPPTPPAAKKALIPPATLPKPTQTAQVTPDAPKDEPVGNAPKVDLPQLGELPPPKIQPQEQPKLPLQNLSQGAPPMAPPDQRRVPLPDTSVRSAIQRSMQDSLPRAPTPPPGEAQAMQLPQLLSDAQGVDFTNYLRVILQVVRRNWQAVIPASAKMYGQEKVSVVLSIKNNGMLGKVVLYHASGIAPLDEPAITGISMSQPFPPFPAGFKGDEIRVQFNFAYNAPKQ